MDMRKLPGDPLDADIFDWDRFLSEVGEDEVALDLRIHETRREGHEPRSWWKAPRLGHWRFPPS